MWRELSHGSCCLLTKSSCKAATQTQKSIYHLDMHAKASTKTHTHAHAVLHTTAYLSFKKAMLSAVRKAATRASGLRIKPNPTIHNSNIKRRKKIHTVHMFIIKNENFEVILLTYRE